MISISENDRRRVDLTLDGDAVKIKMTIIQDNGETIESEVLVLLDEFYAIERQIQIKSKGTRNSIRLKKQMKASSALDGIRQINEMNK